MESIEILLNDERDIPFLNVEYFINLSKILTLNWANPSEWLDAQNTLFKVKQKMEEDYEILDSVNPYLALLNWGEDPRDTNSKNSNIMNEDNLYSVLQVWTWMLIEYYNEYPNVQRKETKTILFEGVISMINFKHYELFTNHRMLFRDIWRFAGRLSRISWEESEIYKDAISILINQLYIEDNIESRSTLMIYFSELVNEMQSKEPKAGNNEK